MDSNKKYKHKYQICEFTDCYNESGQKDLDILPSLWISYDSTQKSLMAPYPGPPYSKQVFSVIQQRVKANQDPFVSWPKWKVVIKGGADTYKKAEDRINILKNEPYAFSTDVDDAEKFADQQSKLYKENALQEIMQVSNSSQSSTSSVDSAINKKKNKRSQKKRANSKKKISYQKPINKLNKEQQDFINGSLNNSDIENVTDKENGNYNGQDKWTVASSRSSNKNSKILAEKGNKKKIQQLSDDQKLISSEYLNLLSAVTTMKVVVLDIQKDVRIIKQNMCGLQDTKLSETLDKNGVTLPLELTEDWDIFMTKLNGNSELKESLKFLMKINLDTVSNNANKSVTNILKKIFTKDLISRFTALKKCENRYLLKESVLYNILKETIISHHKNSDGNFFTEAQFHNALSAAFANAKDWGGRKKHIL